MRYAWIEEHRDAFGIARMCGLLEVSRSGYCQWRGREPSDRARSNALLDAAVSKLHAVSRRSYGRPRIVQGLRKQGLQVGHERVRKSLVRQGLRPLYRAAVPGDDRFEPSQAGSREHSGPAVRWLADQSGVGRRHHLCVDCTGVAVSGCSDGLGKPAHRRVVDERAHERRSRVRCVEVGVLASQTRGRVAHAHRSRQSA